MTYKEKLEKVINKLQEERELTRKGQVSRLTFDDSSTTKVRIRDICKILLQLEDEGILKITGALQPLETLSPDQIINPSENNDYEFVQEIIVEYEEEFDKWYEKYLLKQKSDLQNLDFIVLLRIYDVVLDINEAIQLRNNTTVKIRLHPPQIRFPILFSGDTPSVKTVYSDNRWHSLEYLKEREIVETLEPSRAFDVSDIIVTVKVKLKKFNDFYQNIQAQYMQQKQSEPRVMQPQIVEPDWPIDFRWEGKKYVFSMLGDITFTSKERKHIFKTLTDKKGGWATINELKGNKKPEYVRTTIKQISNRLPNEVKKYLSIIPTTDDDSKNKPNEGAYRIKIIKHTPL